MNLLRSFIRWLPDWRSPSLAYRLQCKCSLCRWCRWADVEVRIGGERFRNVDDLRFK